MLAIVIFFIMTISVSMKGHAVCNILTSEIPTALTIDSPCILRNLYMT